MFAAIFGTAFCDFNFTFAALKNFTNEPVPSNKAETNLYLYLYLLQFQF